MTTMRAVADLVEARFPKLNGKVEINHVGTTSMDERRAHYRNKVCAAFWLDRRCHIISGIYQTEATA